MQKSAFFHVLVVLWMSGACSLFAQSQDSVPQIWIVRDVTPREIYYEGAGGGDTATIHIRAWASADSIFSGSPVDVLLLTDNTGSMSYRQAGYRNWTNPSRIQAVYNAAVTFLDSSVLEWDRVALIRFAGIADTVFGFRNEASDPGFANAKTLIDTFVNGYDGSGYYPVAVVNTAFRHALIEAVDYMVANKRPEATPVIIAMTDGCDNASMNLYGQTWTDVYNKINSAPAGHKPMIFTINIQSSCEQGYMQTVASLSNADWYYSTTGTDLTGIFLDIGRKMVRTVAVSVGPTDPMIVDVLGPNIHYVPSSFIVIQDTSVNIPASRVSFNSDVVTATSGTESYDRLRIQIDSVNIGEILEFEYKITAALREFPATGSKLMRLNNYQTDDATYYSRFKYLSGTATNPFLLDSVVIKPISKEFITVKTRTDGLFLSTVGTAVVPPDPSGAKTITLDYSTAAAGAYGPQDLFAVLQVSATDTFQYSTRGALWQFTTPAGWTINPSDIDNITFTANPASFKNVGISVIGDNSLAVSAPLYAKYLDPLLLVEFWDTLTFTAIYHQVNEYTQSIYITDVAGSQTALPGLTIQGNYGQLDNYSNLLYSMGLTNLGAYNAVNADWRSTGYLSLDYTSGSSSSNTLRLNYLPSQSNTPRNAVDTIIITFNDPQGGLLEDRLVVTILDTTDYDTVDAVVITPWSAYVNVSNKNTLYDTYRDSVSYTPFSGDTVKLAPLLFDVNAGGNEKFLGNASFPFAPGVGVVWYLNGAQVSTDSVYSL
jgi:hypothetical protein